MGRSFVMEANSIFLSQNAHRGVCLLKSDCSSDQRRTAHRLHHDEAKVPRPCYQHRLQQRWQMKHLKAHLQQHQLRLQQRNWQDQERSHGNRDRNHVAEMGGDHYHGLRKKMLPGHRKALLSVQEALLNSHKTAQLFHQSLRHQSNHEHKSQNHWDRKIQIGSASCQMVVEGLRHIGGIKSRTRKMQSRAQVQTPGCNYQACLAGLPSLRLRTVRQAHHQTAYARTRLLARTQSGTVLSAATDTRIPRPIPSLAVQKA